MSTEVSPQATPMSSVGAPTEMDQFLIGLSQSYFLILFSEVGDKTFFLITVLSSKFNRIILFLVSALAMNIMNAVSVGIGSIFPLFLPKIVISIVVIILFLVFGLRMIYTCVTFKEKENPEQELEE